jgi:hypothetical protein
MAKVVLSRGDVTMDQSGVGLLLARRVNSGKNGGVFIMLAGRVDGEVNSVFGPAAGVAFGVALAVALALILWLRRRLF